jgi:hypothetical protein
MEKTRHIIIIGHPKRETQKLKIDNKEYKISFDGFKFENQNEDPFIWNDNFFYTFCHSNDSLSKGVRDLIENQNEEVYFVFVAKAGVDNTQNSEDNTKNEESILEIDTIIKAKKLFEWPGKGERDKNSFSEIFDDSIIKYHLPKLDNGNLTEHNKIKLFTCVGDEEESFLPMVKQEEEGENYYRSYTFDSKTSKDVLKLIQVKNNPAYYVAKETTPRIKNGMETTFNDVSNEISKIIDMYNEPVKDECLSKLTGKQIKEFHEEHRNEKKEK